MKQAAGSATVHGFDAPARTVFEMSGTGMLLANRQGIILEANEACSRLLAYLPERLMGQSFCGLMVGHDSCCPLHQDAQQGAPLWLKLKAGDGRQLLISAHCKRMDQIPDAELYLISIQDFSCPRLTQAVDRQEHFYRALLEHSADIKILVAPDGSIRFGSPSVEKVLGFSEADYLNQNMGLLLHPDDLAIIHGLKQDMEQKPGATMQMQCRLKLRDGSYGWFEGALTNLLDDPHVSAWVYNLHDITQRKESELQIQQANERFRMVTRATSNAIWDWNLETNELYQSEAYLRLFGYNPEADLPDIVSWEKRLHPADARRVLEHLYRSIRQTADDFWQDEYRYIRADGSVAIVHDRGYIIRDESGRPLRMVGAMQDVTEQKLAEHALRESEERYRLVSDNPILGIVWSSPDGHMVQANDAFARMLGYEAHELAGRHYATLSDPGETDRQDELFEQLRQGRISSFRIEKRYRTKDGQVIWGEVNMSAATHASGLLQYMVGIVQNITDRKKAELERDKINSELLKGYKNLEQLTYIVSHNLRAPVANLMGITSLLASGGITEPVRQELLQNLTASVGVLETVLQDLNFVLQVRQDQQQQKEQVDFATLVEQIRISIQHLIEGESVVLETDFTEAETVLSMKPYIHSIFYNLITNSIKYSRPGHPPHIRIRSSRHASGVELHFADNGLGIELGQRKDQVFGMYKRFHNHREGRGLGLFMVKSQVEILGGSIRIESEVNIGTEFFIYLPL